MYVTEDQARALAALRERGFDLSNLQEYGDAVCADTKHGGRRGFVLISPSGVESDPALRREHVQAAPV